MSARFLRVVGFSLGAWCLATVLADSARAATATSCDIVTGASCLWKEGCDCDHDGYVLETGKASKYCHFDKCPIDSNDKSATALGKVSAQNADGDGWTAKYDCDDKNPCIGKVCGTDLCSAKPPDPDKDKDGFPASQDCDDNDANIKPGAGIVCCNCKILTDPVQAASFKCKGCPLSSPAPDAGTTDVSSKDAGSTDAGPDSATPDPGPADGAISDFAVAKDAGAGATDQSASAPEIATSGPTSDALGGNILDAPGFPGEFDSGGGGSTVPQPNGTFVGGGVTIHEPPPPPGCTAGPVAGDKPWFALVVLVVVGLWRSRTSQRVALAALACLLAVSCVRVQPWQRERLAHRCMVLGRNAGEMALEQHTFQYREGAAGGFGGGGGGCGCN